MNSSPTNTAARHFPIGLIGIAFLLAGPIQLAGQTTHLTTLEYRIIGTQLRVSPGVLSVPKGVPGSVLVELSGGSDSIPAGAFVEATLRGSSFPARRIVGQVNAALLLPPLPLVGDYQLDNIRLVRQDGTNLVTLLEGSPSSVPIHVFDEVLVSRVTSRPLSLEEIQGKGIVIDQQNFRAIEFEVGFVLDGKTIPVKFPVVAPTFNQATEIIPAAELEARLREADEINRTLAGTTALPKELETAQFNIDIKGINFQVTEEGDADLQLRIPPIPALMMIPGNIGFLNQFFSVQIFTENAAPQGSGLSAFNILAELHLPPGPDQVASTNFTEPGDDPLRFARVGPDKIIQSVQPVVRPGADGKIGTADDIGRLFSGETGQGEFLVEGLQEGLHVMDLDLTADLDGLAAGTVKIKGKAAGSILVRNPKFSLAFSHPRTIRAGEPYEAYVTVLNTSPSVANLVQVTLPSASISGGVLESAETVSLGSIAPGQTATAKFRIRAQRTGAISFSNLSTSEDSLVGRFRLRMGIDERGVILSPDTLAMPDFVTNLPPALVDAANRVLGQALSVATAPQLPANIKPISKAFVTRRILDLAEAGQRAAYGDELKRILADLLLDWQGGREFNAGFDQIIRETDAGREWREALAKQIDLADGFRAVARLQDRLPDLAGRSEAWSILALDVENGAAQFGAAPSYDDTNSASGLWFVETGSGLSDVVAPIFTWKLSNDVASAELALALIGTNGTAQFLRWSTTNLPGGACVRLAGTLPNGRGSVGTAATLEIDIDCDGTNDVELAATVSAVNELAPSIISVRQDHTVETGRPPKPCLLSGINNYATVAAVLFSKALRQELVNLPSSYQLDNGNSAATVQIQPGGRVALLNLRRPIGPILERSMIISGIADVRGNFVPQTSKVVSNSLPRSAGTAVRGRVARGDGSPAIGVPVTLTMYDQNESLFGCEPFIVRVSQVFTDPDGYFEFDFILAGIPYSVSATDITGLSPEALQLILDSAADDQFNRSKLLELANSASAQDTLLQAFAVGALPQAVAKAEGLDRAILRDFVETSSLRAGTIVPVALRFRGRATLEGQVVGPDGVTPLAGTAVNLFPDPDSRELGRGIFSDASGRFAFFGVPLGAFSIEAKTGTGLARTVSGVLDQPGGTANIVVVLSTNLILRTDLAGRVTEADNVTPHPGASVFVGKFIEGKFQQVVAAATAGSDGYWRASGIPARLYDVVAISLDGKRKGERRNVAADAGATNQITIALQGFGVVIGKVLSTFGPVSNAIVAGGETLARTDSDGNFRLTGVPTGPRTISAGVERTVPGEPAKSHPEFRFPRVGSGEVNVVPGLENFTVIQFQPRGSVIGRVVDETGTNPVSGINVALPESGGFSWVPVNARGEFAFEGIALANHTFSAPAPPVSDTDVTGIVKTIGNKELSEGEIQAAIGEAFAIFTGAADPLLNGEGANFNPKNWGFSEVDLRSDGEVRNVTIQFLKQSTIAGRVLNGQGVPIGARVRLTGIGPARNGAPTTVLRGERNSDPALGTFSFDKEALIGDWGLQAASPFFPVVITASGQTSEIQPNETNVVLQFPSTRETNGRLLGSVFNPDGSLAEAGVKVLIRSRDVEVATDTKGIFNISPVTGLPAINSQGGAGVSYFVEASNHVTGAVGAASVIIFPGVTNIVNVRLLGRGALAVTVLQNDGSPAPDAIIDFEQGTYPQSRGQLMADSNGQVLFQNLFEGSYAACAQFDAGPARLSGRVATSVTAGQTSSVIVRLGPTGTIQGHFVRRDFVTAITFAQVAVGSLGFATTDTNGFFRVGGVPLGTYRLTSQDPVTGIGATLTATLSFNGQTNDITLVEQSRGEIQGAVIASDGVHYVPGVLVNASFFDGITPSRTVTTGPDGRFSFPGSPAGFFQLEAEDPVSGLRGQNSGTLADNVLRLEINVALQPLASLRIATLRPDGATPATNVQVQIFGANVDRTADALSANVVRFTDLPLGAYRIIARSIIVSENNNLAESTATLVSAGQVVSNTIVLAGIGSVSGTVFASDGTTPVSSALVQISQRTLIGDSTRSILTDGNGHYEFENIAAASYQVATTLGVLSGRASGVIGQDGESDTVNLVLAPSGIVIGRLVRADGATPVIGEDVTLEFPERFITAFLARTDQTGRFQFRSVPLGPFVLRSIPLSFNGMARLASALNSDGETNDIGLLVTDEDDPHVISVFPPNTATGIPIASTVELLFNEALAADSIFPTGIYLQGPTSTIPASVTLVGTGSIPSSVRLTPNAPLRSLTTYQIIVIDGDRKDALGQVIGRGPEDLVGRPLIAPFISTFTTADNDPPQLLSMFPTNGQIQVDTRAVIRVAFNEPIRDSNFVATVTEVGETSPLPGTPSVGLNGLVLGFAPDPPLLPNKRYTVTASNIFDLAGNRAANEPFIATFATLDTLGPQIELLRIADNRSPVAGTSVPIEAMLKMDEPGASVHFTKDFQAAGLDTNAPYRINVSLPFSGTTTLRAIASDRFGNQGVVTQLVITVVSNQPPSIELARANPATGSVSNGQPYSITLSASDDVEVTNLTLSLRAGTGLSAFTFASGSVQTLSFTVPNEAIPGELIHISARATDSLGLSSSESTLEIQISDGTPPAVAILSPAPNALLTPPSPLDLQVTSSDNAVGHRLELVIAGGITATQSLNVVAAPNTSVTNLFVVSLAGAATDGTPILATVRAIDASNLIGSASRTLRLPDLRPPALVSITPSNGSTAQSLWLSAVAFDFDEAIDPLTVDTNQVIVSTTPFSLRLTNEQRRLLIQIATPLDAGQLYSVRLRPDIADTSSNLWRNIGGSAVPAEGAEFTFTTAAILGVSPTNNAEVFAGQTAVMTVNFQAGLGADFFRFVLNSGAPVDIPVNQTATTASVGLLMPATPSLAHIVITAHHSSETPYHVADLDLQVVQPPGGGTVRGVVTLPNSQIVSNATVVLTASNVSSSASTDSTGTYEFHDIPLGPVRVVASDPATNLRGFNTGALSLPGQTLTLNLPLSASGTITGTVFRVDGVTRVANATVSITSIGGTPLASPVTTDSQGLYTFDFVPLGTFTVDVSDAATGDRGRISSQLNSSGQIRTLDVMMNGQGRLVVAVKDGSNKAVSNAQVQVFGQTVFGGSQTGITESDGTAAFEGVLAGIVFVTAFDPLTSLSGSAGGTVALNTTTTLTIGLQPAGNIVGKVFNLDGTNPVAGVTVRLVNQFLQVLRETASGQDGSFAFERIALGRYGVEALDSANELRARERDIVLSSNGVTQVRNLIFVGLGTVTGRVLNPDDTGASDLPVTLQSSHPQIGASFFTTSGTDGVYTLSGVPVGSFNVSAVDSSRQLQGEGNGQVVSEGQVANVDIRLVDNSVNLPQDLFDGNSMRYDVNGNGSLQQGQNSVFSVSVNGDQGGMLLDVFVAGVPNRFTGGSIGFAEGNGREVAVRQDGLAGLEVKRKVFVPREGYFARYLELLHNGSGSGITVDVRLRSSIRRLNGSPRIITTSSGDSVLATVGASADQWVVIDDNADGDPFLTFSQAPLVFAFDGSNAPQRAASATFTAPSAGQFSVQWTNVTVGPGETVGLMHFVAQQVNRAGAKAAAERLAQLPPEALEGLSLEELAAVRNFVVPPNGVSGLADLVLPRGVISGRVLGSDGVTPIAFANIEFQSTNVLFNRIVSFNSGEDGRFLLRPRFDEFDVRVVPLDAFRMRVTHPNTSVALDQQGAFPQGRTNVTGNLAMLSGIAAASSFLSGGEGARAIDGDLSTQWFVDFSEMPSQGGRPFLDVFLAADSAVRQVNLRSRPFDCCNLFLRGRVDLFDIGDSNLFSQEVVFPESHDVELVIAGDEPSTVRRVRFTGLEDTFFSVPSLAELEVVGSAMLENVVLMDLVFTNTGSIGGSVRRHTGGLVNGSGSISVLSNSSFATSVTLSNDATYLATGIRAGSYTVIASVDHPQGSPLLGTNTVRVTNGVTSIADITLPPTGTLVGTIRDASGNLESAFVQLSTLNFSFSRSTSSDSAGSYALPDLPLGSYRFTVFDPRNSIEVTNVVSVFADRVTTNDVALRAVGFVAVQVNFADGSPASGVVLNVQMAGQGFFQFAGSTDGSGQTTIANVPEGQFVVRAFHPANGSLSADATNRISFEGEVVPVTIALPGTGIVQGQVTFARGLAAGNVQLQLSGADVPFQNAQSAANGTYSFIQVPTGRPFNVRALNPSNTSFFREVTNLVLTADGQTLTNNLVLPALATLRVTVLQADNSPLAGARVLIRNAFQTSFQSAGTADSTGVLNIANVPEGAFAVQAQHPSTAAFAGSAGGTIAQPDDLQTVNITINSPTFGSVQGTVVAADTATPVPSVFLEVLDAASGQNLTSASTGTNGLYQAAGFAAGPGGIRVVAHSPHDFAVSVSGTATFTNGSQPAVINLTLPVSVIRGTVFQTNGVSPVQFPNVIVLQTNQSGFLSPVSAVFSGQDGKYLMVGVSTGEFTVVAKDFNSRRAGKAVGTLASITVPLQVNVTVGDFVFFNFNFDGADGFRYDIECQGSLDDGGTANGRLEDAYDSAYGVRVAGNTFQCEQIARLDAGGRQIVLGPQQIATGGQSSLEVTRKIFVPSSGGFARYLEILANRTVADQLVAVRVDGDLGSDSRTRVVALDTGAQSGAYAVTDDALTGTPSDPALAHVFGGPGARLAVSALRFENGNDDFFYEWNVPVPAGQTAILMHFAVQREPTNSAGAQLQAEALRDLSPTNALAGMSADELAAILNFNAAPPIPSRIDIISVESEIAGAMSASPLVGTRSTAAALVAIRWNGSPSQNITIQTSTNLIHWTDAAASIEEVQPGCYIATIITDPVRTRFFRLKY